MITNDDNKTKEQEAHRSLLPIDMQCNVKGALIRCA